MVVISICTTSCSSCSSEEEYSYIEPSSYYNNQNVSFKGVRNSCNIPSHHCAYGVDNNGDGWCDNCWDFGYKCHMVNHQGR